MYCMIALTGYSVFHLTSSAHFWHLLVYFVCLLVAQSDWVAQSCLTLPSHGLWPTRLLCPWNSPGKNTGAGCHFLLQGIFPTQRLNPRLPHCRQILYHLSHWKVVTEPRKTPGLLASRGEEFNSGPEKRLDRSELLCSKVLLKCKV